MVVLLVNGGITSGERLGSDGGIGQPHLSGVLVLVVVRFRRDFVRFPEAELRSR